MSVPQAGEKPTPAPSKERLVDTAIGLLHSNGYRAVGVQALCERAGVRKGSFYHFFGSKEELTLAALNRAWQEFRENVIDPVLATTEDPAERASTIRRACIRPALEEHRHETGPHGCIFGRLAASITDGEPLLRARLGEIFTEWAGLLGEGPQG